MKKYIIPVLTVTTVSTEPLLKVSKPGIGGLPGSITVDVDSDHSISNESSVLIHGRWKGTMDDDR